LEKAVRWVIILIVIVFDPLALTLLLAATKTFEWERSVNVFASKRQRTDNGALTEDQLKQINDALHDTRDKKELDEFFDRAKQTAHSIDTDTYEPPEQELVKNKSILAGLDNMWNRTKNLVNQDTEAEHAPIEEPVIDRIDDEFTKDKIAERAWKDENPGKTLKHERDLLDAGVIKILPWQEPAFRARVLGEIGLTADNTPHSGEVKGFGTQFPASPGKGDMFLRVDRLPSALYKFNGNIWIEVDKSLSDQHAYNAAYIDHLISKIGTGEYDPELLSEAERTSIEQRLSGA
jgi:hypothetical protein